MQQLPHAAHAHAGVVAVGDFGVGLFDHAVILAEDVLLQDAGGLVALAVQQRESDFVFGADRAQGTAAELFVEIGYRCHMTGGRIEFGPFVLDPDRGVLLREGESISIGHRALALLDALLVHPGAVDKASLMEAAWPGVIVEEGNLTVQIAALRKALGPRDDGSEWIVTVPRVGYRLVRGEVAPAGEAPLLPSLAVLPFQNLSGDPEQDYFADGIVEDITTALSRFKSFAVVARQSSFAYKGRVADLRQISNELDVRYLLEGSVRRSGRRLRITTQLVDGTTGAHLWAQNFDGTIEDVFDMQDRVTDNVVAIVEPKVRQAEIQRSRRKRPDSMDAYDLYLQALPNVFAMRPEANAQALSLLQRAMRIDPGFAPAIVMAGMTYLARITMQLAGASDDDWDQAVGYARRALATGSDDPMVFGNAGFLLLEIGRQYDEGFALLRRAASENPNNVGGLTNLGIACLLSGDLEEGADCLDRAIALNPNEFGTHWQLTGIAHIRVVQGRYEEALVAARKSLGVNSGYDATYWMLIAANAFLGQMNEAGHFVARLLELSPHATLTRIRRGQHSRDPRRIDVLIEGMRLAGFPEGVA